METNQLTPELKGQIVDIIYKLSDVLAKLVIPEISETAANGNKEFENEELGIDDLDENEESYRDQF